MLKVFPIDFIRQIFEQKLYEERTKDINLFGGDDQINIFSFYEQLKGQNEVDRFVENYRDLTDQQNRTGLIGNGVLVSPENPSLTNIYSATIVPMTWSCAMRCTLGNRDRMVYTINNLIEKLKGRKVDVAQLDCIDDEGNHFAQPFGVGTIGQYQQQSSLKNGDYIGEITNLTDINTKLNALKSKNVLVTKDTTNKRYLYVGNDNQIKVVCGEIEKTTQKSIVSYTVTIISNHTEVITYKINGLYDLEDLYPTVVADLTISKIGESATLTNLVGTITSANKLTTETEIVVSFDLTGQTYPTGLVTISSANEKVYLQDYGWSYVTDDGTIDAILFPPEHDSFEKYKMSFSFDTIRCDEPRTLNAEEYCELTFSGSATLVSNGVSLGNDLLKVSFSKNLIPASTDITYSENIAYLEPLELPSGNSPSTKVNQLISNQFISNTHTDALAITLQYTFILDTTVSLLKQWFDYARYGTQSTSLSGISPNIIYQVVEMWCSWGDYENKSFLAKINESIDVENTESDTLTITIPMQLQGANN